MPLDGILCNVFTERSLRATAIFIYACLLISARTTCVLDGIPRAAAAMEDAVHTWEGVEFHSENCSPVKLWCHPLKLENVLHPPLEHDWGVVCIAEMMQNKFNFMPCDFRKAWQAFPAFIYYYSFHLLCPNQSRPLEKLAKYELYIWLQVMFL